MFFWWVLGMILVMVIAFCWIGIMIQLWHARCVADRRLYDSSHPRISDEEFVKLCSPGTDPEMAIKVRQIIAETLCVDKERIYPDSRFIEDLWA